jgi:surface antigen
MSLEQPRWPEEPQAVESNISQPNIESVSWRTKICRILATAALMTSGMVASETFHPSAARAADSDTYSWSGATPLDEASDDYGYATCPSNDTGCDSMTYTSNGYGEADPWDYNLRNCTSYVAEKISQEFNGRNISGWGYAYQWAASAEAADYTLDSTPEVGDIAVWGREVGNGDGHVAYVASVTDGVATFDEYNVHETGEYTNSYTSADHPGGQVYPDWYIHMGTPASSDTTSIPQGSAVLASDGLENVFARGVNDEIYDNAWNGSSWSNFLDIDPGAEFLDNPVAFQYGSQQWVFAKADNDQIYLNTWDGSSWSSFKTIASTAVFDGDPTVAQSGDVLNVFGRGTDDEIYENTWNGSAWSGFLGLESGAYFSGNPEPIQFGTDQNVFARGTNNEIYVNTWDGSAWSGFTSLEAGYTFAGDPTVVNYESNEYVFALGTNGQIYCDEYDGSWTGFTSLSGLFTFNSDPVAIVFDGVLNVFAIGTNDEMYVNTWDGSTWSGFADLETGADFVGNPVAVQSGSVENLFALGENSEIYEDTWDGGWGIFGALDPSADFEGFSN